MKTVSIIGGGGLAAGALFASQGVKVNVYEKNAVLGGRSSRLTIGNFHFDTGPTFLLYKPLLDELFSKMKEKVDDYLTLTNLDPLCHLIFKDFTFKPSSKREKTLKEISRLFPGDEAGYKLFLNEQEKKFTHIEKIMRMPFDKAPCLYLNSKNSYHNSHILRLRRDTLDSAHTSGYIFQVRV